MLDRRLKEAMVELREYELKDAKLSLKSKAQKQESETLAKELVDLKDKVTRLNDPVVVRFERDGLV